VKALELLGPKRRTDVPVETLSRFAWVVRKDVAAKLKRWPAWGMVDEIELR
jgi:hypothetical protein